MALSMPVRKPAPLYPHCYVRPQPRISLFLSLSLSIYICSLTMRNHIQAHGCAPYWNGYETPFMDMWEQPRPSCSIRNALWNFEAHPSTIRSRRLLRGRALSRHVQSLSSCMFAMLFCLSVCLWKPRRIIYTYIYIYIYIYICVCVCKGPFVSYLSMCIHTHTLHVYLYITAWYEF